MKYLCTPKQSPSMLSQRDWRASSGSLGGSMRGGGVSGNMRNPFDNNDHNHFSTSGGYSMELSLTPRTQRKVTENDGDLIGVLRQVSEMTMSETRVQRTPMMLCSTPIPGGMFCRTPDQTGKSDTYDQTKAHRVFLPYDGEKAQSTAFLPESGCDADARVFDAPPLPSSPELSMSSGGIGGTRRAVPPQFSPIASFHPADPPRPLPSILPQPQFRMPPPKAPPRVLAPIRDTNAPPPPMPWMDTPENHGQRQVFPMKMRRRNSGYGLGHTALNFSE